MHAHVLKRALLDNLGGIQAPQPVHDGNTRRRQVCEVQTPSHGAAAALLLILWERGQISATRGAHIGAAADVRSRIGYGQGRGKAAHAGRDFFVPFQKIVPGVRSVHQPLATTRQVTDAAARRKVATQTGTPGAYRSRGATLFL